MNVETKMRYHFTPGYTIQKTTTMNVGWGVERQQLLGTE